jgi:hypothetical protein
MNKFPSFKSAPKLPPAPQHQAVKVTQPKPNLFFDDSKGDPEFFRYGKFKDKIEYGRLYDDSPNEMNDGNVCPFDYQEGSNLPVKAMKFAKIKPVEFIEIGRAHV